jgi:hypothetical protein
MSLNKILLVTCRSKRRVRPKFHGNTTAELLLTPDGKTTSSPAQERWKAEFQPEPRLASFTP